MSEGCAGAPARKNLFILGRVMFLESQEYAIFFPMIGEVNAVVISNS